jgi:hypothetical protein
LLSADITGDEAAKGNQSIINENIPTPHPREARRTLPRGVYRRKGTPFYRAIIRVAGHQVYLGNFNSVEEAAKVVAEARAKDTQALFAATRRCSNSERDA